MHVRRSAPPGSRFDSCSGSSYLCNPSHRDSSLSHLKSQWSVSEEVECHVFCLAEGREPQTVAESIQLWTFAENLRKPLGTRGEVVARFLPPASGSSEWHGHPVGKGSPGGVKTAPLDKIEEWESRQLISRAFARKLRKRSV